MEAKTEIQSDFNQKKRHQEKLFDFTNPFSESLVGNRPIRAYHF